MTCSNIMYSPAGPLKITCNEDKITSINFIATGAHDLVQTYHPLLAECVQQLQDYFTSRRKTFDLPLLQEGTEFQKKIWQLLMDIPYGTTISYLQLSKQWGDTMAIRAVAAANGKNKLAIVVPCHRVIGSNGSLTGYAGGLKRKKWLLAHEGKQARLDL
jgi:methylated-DNA-[protein]-cysteine S-methyltransferase